MLSVICGHLDEKYHAAICTLGAKFAQITLSKPCDYDPPNPLSSGAARRPPWTRRPTAVSAAEHETGLVLSPSVPL
jgi:hypothetical protein